MDEQELAKATPAQRSELTGLQKDRDAKKEDVDSFNNDQCKKDEVAKMKDELEKSTDTSGGGGSGTDMTPKMVIPEWFNGAPDYQLIALGIGETKTLAAGPRGVRVGAINMRTKDSDIPEFATYAFAQSEFFFDCKGGWKSPDCNGNYELKDGEGAMWHFRWRGRLRRYNAPHAVAKGVAAPTIAAQLEAGIDMAPALARHITGPGNIARRKDLADAMASKTDDIILH
jgi:hypothetical protein